MKPLFYTKTLIALAVAVAAAAAAVSQAQEQPIPPPSTDSALPADIVPGTPLADVVKMARAGVDVNTIRSYIVNSQSAFNLDADKILFLKDEGLPSDLINAMMDRDKALYASTMTPPPAPVPVQTTEVVSAPDTAPPPTEVTVDYFDNTLTPYGTWVEVDGYGRCWRPTAVIYDADWRPYGDRGHWIYTDAGWYWDSDYSWGITFHYGRWFHHARFGWCWYPDTVWAPSWVTWRSGGDFCGWAPLPPFAEFRPGFGFYFRGASVGFDFDFGLAADCFMFVHAGHFCDRQPRSYFVERTRVTEVFRQTTIINNYEVNNRIVVNRGISVDRIRSVTHRDLQPVHVASLPNAGRQGFRGEGFERTLQRGAGDSHPGGNFNNSGGNGQLRHGPEQRGEINPAGNLHANNGQTFGTTANHGSFVQPGQGAKPIGNQTGSTHVTAQQYGGQANNNSSGAQFQQRGNVNGAGTHFQPSSPPSVAANPAAVDHHVTQNNSQFGSVNNSQFGNASHGQSQAVSREPSTYQSRQYGVSAGQPAGVPQHAAAQLQQQPQFVPAQPRVEARPSYVEPAQHSAVSGGGGAGAGQAPAQSASGGSSNGGGNGGNGGRNVDNGRGNH